MSSSNAGVAHCRHSSARRKDANACNRSPDHCVSGCGWLSARAKGLRAACVEVGLLISRWLGEMERSIRNWRSQLAWNEALMRSVRPGRWFQVGG